MTARELLAWGNLEERRRREARRGLGALSPWVFAFGAGVLFFGEVARRLGALGGEGEPVSASRLWMAACAAAHVIVFFGAPFRTYWRFDSALLARLPLDGGALFRLSWARALRATARVALPCAAGALAFGPLASWEAALRHLSVLGVAVLGAGFFAPAVALAAGAAVASAKTQALMRSFGGELEAPRTTWLGALPGFGATALAVALLAAAPWAAGGRPPGGDPLYVFLPGVGVPLAALAWALARARTVMPGALREVSALDQERLAHVERSTPSLLERAWFRSLLGPGEGARLVAEKDASLSRRRYPSPYLLFPLGVGVIWILCAARPADLVPWAGAILGCLGAYAALMARRLGAPPVEQPRLLRSLPIPPRAARAAKRAHASLRVLYLFLLAGLPVVGRALDWILAAGAVGALFVGSLVASMWAAAEPGGESGDR